MVAYLPHNRCSQFSGTSSAQLPIALSIPIIFSHMYTLGRIPALKQRGFYFSSPELLRSFGLLTSQRALKTCPWQ